MLFNGQSGARPVNGLASQANGCEAARNQLVRIIIEVLVLTLALKSFGADPNAAKVTGVTPLFVACKTSYSAKGDAANATSLSLASALLDSGAKGDLCPHDGCSPLFVAARRGRAEVVRLLLDKGGAEPGRRNRCAMLKLLKSLFNNFSNKNISDTA